MIWGKKKDSNQMQIQAKFIVNQSQINKRVYRSLAEMPKTMEIHEKAIRMLDYRIHQLEKEKLR
jgi:hypothetical protein